MEAKKGNKEMKQTNGISRQNANEATLLLDTGQKTRRIPY